MMRPIVDLFGDIVSKVSNALVNDFQALDSHISGVHYQHGHILEIVDLLTQKDQSQTYKYDKYPLVALLQDFPERITVDSNRFVEANLNILIVKSTLEEYTADKRYDENFKPFLYPIYNELLKQINKSAYTLTYSPYRIRHTKIDRLFWGRQGRYGNTANIANDKLDAIEIQNLNLKFIREKCLLTK